MAAVNTDESKFIFEKMDSDICYTFPKPAKLVSTIAPGKDKVMIHSWVKYRPLMLHSISSSTSPPKPQPPRAWEALLTAEYVSTNGQDPQQKRQKLQNDMIAFVGHTELKEVDELELSTADAKWEGRVVGDLQAEDYEQVLWELVELNFHFEFQALDQRLSTRSGTFPVGRSTRIRQCFPGGCLLVADWRVSNHGIASEQLREKAHYLFLMASLLINWPKVNTNGWIGHVESQLKWSEDEVDNPERDIAEVYTQTFFNAFRCAPVVPLRLSERSVPLPEWFAATLAPTMENSHNIMMNTLALGDMTSSESLVSSLPMENRQITH